MNREKQGRDKAGLLQVCGPAQLHTFMKLESFLLVTITSPVRVVVRPWEDGKLRRGGGGGGDLEGFSVRYLGTVNSSREMTKLAVGAVPFTSSILCHC